VGRGTEAHLYWNCDASRDRESTTTELLVGFPALYSRLLAGLMRRMPNEQQRLLAITILAGGLCGLAAVSFHISTGFVQSWCINRATSAPGHSWIW